jgi:hypothetical protein
MEAAVASKNRLRRDWFAGCLDLQSRPLAHQYQHNLRQFVRENSVQTEGLGGYNFGSGSQNENSAIMTVVDT